MVKALAGVLSEEDATRETRIQEFLVIAERYYKYEEKMLSMLDNWNDLEEILTRV